MHRGSVPAFLAYEHVKVPVPGGRRREPKILIYCWQQEVVFPEAPVFHAQPVTTPQSQYGALNVAPGSMFPGVRPSSSSSSIECMRCATPLDVLCRDTFSSGSMSLINVKVIRSPRRRHSPSCAVWRSCSAQSWPSPRT